MPWLALGMASLLGLAIIAIGIQFILALTSATRFFGLPLPEDGPNIPWWIRLKGVRDIASGLTVLSMIAWGPPRMVGIILLAEAVIPVGDMSLILAAKGSTGKAIGMHGATAVVMVVTAIALITSVP
jgi:hypothetical protein